MERLPSDVFSVVLHKLAVQDPRSLLRATCACKTLHREADVNNRGIWKDALFGKDSRFGEHCKSEEIEAKILDLGGYKQLVKARCISPGSLFFEQKQGAGRVNGHNGWALPVSSTKTYYGLLKEHLVVLRENGRVLLWGLRLLQMDPFILQEVGDFGFRRYEREGKDPVRISLAFFTPGLELLSPEDQSIGLPSLKLLARGSEIQRNNLELEMFTIADDALEITGHLSSREIQFARNLKYKCPGVGIEGEFFLRRTESVKRTAGLFKALQRLKELVNGALLSIGFGQHRL